MSDHEGQPVATDERPPPEQPAAPPRPPRRRSAEPVKITWTRALLIGVAAFLVWLLVDAPTLQHNAQVSPVGVRRTVSLGILGPVATLSRVLQLSHIESVFAGATGHAHNGPAGGSVKQTVGPKGHQTAGGGNVDPSRHLESTPGVTTTTAPPSAAAPLRVLIAGDSLGIDLGDTLENDLANTGVVQATLDGQIDTGLSRPDYFNWPAELAGDLKSDNPQVVVIMIGANDDQDFPGPPDVPYGSAGWTATYTQRVAQFMQEATSTGAQVVWVGMPPMADSGRSQDMATLDSIYQAEAAKVPHVTYLSSWTVVGTPQGQYTAYLDVNGQEVNVREPDGTHIAPGGAELISQDVMATIRNQLHIALP